MKWVSLFKAESSVHSLPFFSWWTLQFHKEEEKNRKKGRRVIRGGGLQWRRKRRENDVWRSRNLPLHWDMIGFSLVQEWPTKKKSKQIQNGALKQKMREEEEDFLLGCRVVLCDFLFFFLFRKATLGFDAVVVVRGLAAATGFRLGALLDVRLRHTPPGGEVEGHSPSSGQSAIPLHAVPLQLHKWWRLHHFKEICDGLLSSDEGKRTPVLMANNQMFDVRGWLTKSADSFLPSLLSAWHWTALW